jgi:hypothetical protein
MSPEERMLTDYWVFDINGTMVKKFANGITFGGPYPWVFIGDDPMLKINNKTEYTVTSLTKDEMVLVSVVEDYTADGKPDKFWMRETLYHKTIMY